MQKGRGGGGHNAVGAESVDGLLDGGDRGGKVVLPNVAAGDDTDGELELAVLEGGEDGVELGGGAVHVDVEGLDGEVLEEVDVVVEAAEVCSIGKAGGCEF